MIIKVEKRKTDQLRQGHQAVIAWSAGSVCPVSLLKAYLRKLDIDPQSNEKNKPIFYTTFRDQLTYGK